MIKTLKTFISGLGVIALMPYLPQPAPAVYARAQAGAYLTLSDYYAHPGQEVTVSGHRFSAAELVSLSFAGVTQAVVADGQGNFTAAPVSVPYAAIDSSQAVTAQGTRHTASAELVIGTYYPVVVPGGWYLAPGGWVSFAGRDFAPGETVNISAAGRALGAAGTDSFGRFSSRAFQVPFSGGSLTYKFVGQSSGVSATATVHISGEPAYLILDHYYVRAGDDLQISGHAFGDGENVALSIGGIAVGNITADSGGGFVAYTPVPQSVSGNAIKVTAIGSRTRKTAQTSVTLNNQTRIKRKKSFSLLEI